MIMLLTRSIWTAATVPRLCILPARIRPQFQSFHTLPPLNKKNPPPPSALEGAPRSYGKKVEEFTPKPLDRPIGLPNPPRVGENSGIDRRTWSQKWEDWNDRDKKKKKREKITAALSTPYFREFTNMNHHKGKSFLCPPGLFRSDRALYFPNLYGQTLLKTGGALDTTPVLKGKISVVCIYSSIWAQKQIATLTAKSVNPELHNIFDEYSDSVQFVEINVEPNWAKALIVQCLKGSLRNQVQEKNWGRYFLVKRSLDQEIRDAIGLLNSKVGYTYLLDEQCRIRWASSGPAREEELKGLTKGVRRLIGDT